MEVPPNGSCIETETNFLASAPTNHDDVENVCRHSNPGSVDSESKTTTSSSDSIAKGLSSMIVDVISDFDAKAQDTIKSQDNLALAIDRLTNELDRLLEDAPLPFIMQHATKISGVRKRVSSLNSLLKSIQRRIDNIDRMLSIGNQEKMTAGKSF